jgi:AcrR family transcriptional regulator
MLIDKAKLARNRRERADRKDRIVAAARRAFLRMPYSQVSLETIAKQAKVSDGHPAMFFGSKEELFVQILQREMRDWGEELETTLAAALHPLVPADLVAILARSMSESELLTRMLSLVPMVIEQHPNPNQVLGLFHATARTTRRLGSLLDEMVADFNEGDGVRLLHRLHVVVPGLQEHTRPTGLASLRQADSELASVQGDFETELAEMLGLLVGLQS